MTLLLRVSVLLLALVSLTIDCHAREFQNLDFESPLFDRSGLPPYFGIIEIGLRDDLRDPSVVIPGWSLRAEGLDGADLNNHQDCGTNCFSYPAHEALIDGHLGQFANVVLNIRGRGPQYSLQGDYSLSLAQAFHSGPLTPPTPTLFQTGVVPIDAQSVLVQVASHAFDTPDQVMNGDEPAEFFSVRFQGHEVDMHLVDLADFGDAHAHQQTIEQMEASRPSNYEEWNKAFETSGLPLPYPPLPVLHGGVFYAGNISAIAGLERELAIRPEPHIEYRNEFGSMVSGSMLLDNIVFSTYPAPGAPVRAPEPTATVLLVIGLAGHYRCRRRA